MRTDVSLRCPRTAVDSQRPPGRRADLIRSARRDAAAARPGRMSRQVIWEAQAIDQAAGFLHDELRRGP